MKPILSVGIVGALSLLAAQVALRNADRSHATVVALQVRYEEILKQDPMSPGRISTKRLLAIAADGSEAFIDHQFTHDGTLALSHRHLTLAGGITADIIDNLRSVTAYRASDPKAEDIRRALERWDPNTGCGVTFNGARRRGAPVRTERVLGYEANVFVSGRITTWVSPQLGCLELRRLGEFPDTSELIATEIMVQAPPQELFRIQADFTNVSPSEMYLKESAFRGLSPSPAELKQLAGIDEPYWRTRYVAPGTRP